MCGLKKVVVNEKVASSNNNKTNLDLSAMQHHKYNQSNINKKEKKENNTNICLPISIQNGLLKRREQLSDQL